MKLVPCPAPLIPSAFTTRSTDREVLAIMSPQLVAEVKHDPCKIFSALKTRNFTLSVPKRREKTNVD